MNSLLTLAASQNVELTRALTVQILNCLAYMQRRQSYEKGSARYIECEDAAIKILNKLGQLRFLVWDLQYETKIDWATELSNI